MTTDLLCFLSEKYNESHRKYHTLSHISSIFNFVKKHDIQLTRPQIISIWFHDVVFNYESEDQLKNKEKCASLAFDYAYDQVGKKEAVTVGTIIEDLGRGCSTIDESKVVLDLDVWDYSSIDFFNRRRRLIKLEYLFAFDENEYKLRRRKQLSKLVDKDRIYCSEYFDDKLEKIAYNNLTNELDSIGGKIKDRVVFSNKKSALGDQCLT